MHWSSNYVGLPWAEKGGTRAGLSCWGLARHVFIERFGVDLPSYDDLFASHAEIRDVDAVVAGATARAPWSRVKVPREMDVAVFRRAGVDCHVGLMIGPSRMLHIVAGQDSAIVDVTSGRWAPRLNGFYRHEALA
jgi:cell wall-associated NlpC family hydrolase